MRVDLGDLIISDDTNEIDENTYFLKTFQNEKYLPDLKKYKKIISPKEAFGLLGIDEDIKIVGITGTNGKTTTAAAIYSILLDLGKSVAMQGTRGFYINSTLKEEKSLTTPPILQILYHLHLATKEKCQYFIMEVSSHAIFQRRIEGLKFALKIFTNLSQDHLDFHQNMQEYARVKNSFFEDEGLKLINKDDPHVRYNVKGARTYGVENQATYKVSAYSLKNGIDAVMLNGDKTIEFHSPLRGFFNLYNLACAISAVHLLENPKNFDMVENFAGVSGRMEVVHENPAVIVDFAHTPDGMEKVLDALKSENLVVVFGAGGDRDKTKRPLMAKVACRYANKIYITSDNPRSEKPESIIADITKNLQTNKKVFIEKDRKKALHLALENLQPHETLMILGKGDETYQEINGVKYPFDDREIVRTFYKI
ncbi:MAG: UDP-N-acetylmuramoyl-L-alanyl-D-glutamate--2,6-diaminopimelate ligase [Proteobacteria bacterium]|nr:MAG: UDP-N-acetylmuramoyl-L-alanyl-D-glutamate--2,6-diaminopimelate ligase [Pseudomonadota bacterium]